MKNLIKILIVSVVVLSTACTDDFEEINTNTGLPVEVNPGALLLNVGFNIAGEMHIHDWGQGIIVNHYNEAIQGSETARYVWDGGTGAGLWNDSYRILTDVVDMYNQAEVAQDPNYQAVAMIYRTYLFSIMVNSFGDIPFSQAIAAFDEDKDFTRFFPTYDEQSSIYPQLISDLETANSMLNVGTGLINGGDVLYGGDIMKWKKFANSLRLRLLTTISNTSFDVSSQMQAIVNDPNTYPIFTSNDDNAIYLFGGTNPDVNQIDGYRDWDFNSRKPSAFFLDSTLERFNDPRIPIWFQPTPATADADVKVYNGLPHGLFEEEATLFAESNLSRMNEEYFRQKTTPCIFMTFSEVQFILAEAAHRGWITPTESVQNLYESGILASMEHWGADATGYLDQEGVAFEDDVNQILLHKYIALYFTVGMEGWTQFRRTGQPEFPVGAGNQNGGQIANRFLYPNFEQTLNGNSYQEAIARIGGDDINNKLWWQN